MVIEIFKYWFVQVMHVSCWFGLVCAAVDVFAPIYASNQVPDSPEKRVARLRGVVQSKINVEKLFLTAVTKLPPWPMVRTCVHFEFFAVHVYVSHAYVHNFD